MYKHLYGPLAASSDTTVDWAQTDGQTDVKTRLTLAIRFVYTSVGNLKKLTSEKSKQVSKIVLYAFAVVLFA